MLGRMGGGECPPRGCAAEAWSRFVGDNGGGVGLAGRRKGRNVGGGGGGDGDGDVGGAADDSGGNGGRGGGGGEEDGSGEETRI